MPDHDRIAAVATGFYFHPTHQVLAEIDPRPFEVQLQQAQGTLVRDTANLANAKLDLERYTQLLAQDAIPKQQPLCLKNSKHHP